MGPFSNLVLSIIIHLRCVAKMAKPHILQNADPIAGTLPHFSQDLCQAVCFATAIANQYGYSASATKIHAGPKFLRMTDIQDGTVSWDTVPYCRTLIIGKISPKAWRLDIRTYV